MIGNLFRETWEILKAYPILFLPPLFFSFISSLLLPNAATKFSFLPIISLVLLGIAVDAGWFNQIKVALSEDRNNPTREKVSFSDFLVGIGKFFKGIFLGELFALFIAGTLFFLLGILGAITVGIPDKAKIEAFKKIIMLSKPADISLQQDPDLIKHLSIWVLIIMVWLSIWLLFSCIIFLWKQYLVLNGTNWLTAWYHSIHFIRNNFYLSFLVLSIQGLIFIVVYLNQIISGNAFFTILSFLANILFTAYFAVLYFLIINSTQSNVATNQTEEPKIAE